MAPGSGGGERRLDPRSALLASLRASGRIDWPAIARLSGRSPEQVRGELLAIGAVFRNPDGGDWQTREAYLSGNVRAKLRIAQAATRINPAFQANVEALIRVQPVELKPGAIYASLGASWIPPEEVQTFAAERLGLEVHVDYIPKLAKWLVQPTARYKNSRRQQAIA